MGGTAFTHDARGNLTSDGTRTYTYDPFNRLTGITGGGASVTLAYDPLGRLKTLTSGGVATDWLWDGDRLVGEYNAGGTLTARYLHGTGPDEPLAQVSGTRRWFLGDTQGSIIAETDTAGALVGNAITYDPDGQPGSWTGPRFGYTGQMRLTATVPLWHYKARAYDPRIGRFLQTDPIGYEDSLNLYAYVGNDPVNNTDPTGECCTLQLGGTIDVRLGPLRFRASVGIAMDGRGNLATYRSGSAGANVDAPLRGTSQLRRGASITPTVQVTNADRVTDLRGLSQTTSLGGSLEGIAASVGYTEAARPDGEGRIRGISLSPGLGVVTPYIDTVGDLTEIDEPVNHILTQVEGANGAVDRLTDEAIAAQRPRP